MKRNRNKCGPAGFTAPKEGPREMLAPLGTLAFLATLWLLTVVGAAMLEESGAKIAAALKGKPRQGRALAPVRIRARSRLRRPIRAAARWRDAA
jgi:hypothetical protein